MPHGTQRSIRSMDEPIRSPGTKKRSSSSRPRSSAPPSAISRRQPRYNVLLWDSDDHTFEYVEKMLRELFGHEPEQCKVIAKDVDSEGRAVVLTTTRSTPS